MTLKPSLCNRWQIAVPMPPMPPVTYATFAISVSVVISPSYTRRCVSHMHSGEFLDQRGRLGTARRRPRYICKLSLSLHCKGDAHAATDAKRRESLLRVASLHFVQQRDQHAAARSADRVTERDGTAVDVDLVLVGRLVQAEVLVHGTGLRRESLVEFHQVELLGLPAGLLESLAGRGRRAHAHQRRIDTGGGKAD